MYAFMWVRNFKSAYSDKAITFTKINIYVNFTLYIDTGASIKYFRIEGNTKLI